jgi:hypothetical protein
MEGIEGKEALGSAVKAFPHPLYTTLSTPSLTHTPSHMHLGWHREGLIDPRQRLHPRLLRGRQQQPRTPGQRREEGGEVRLGPLEGVRVGSQVDDGAVPRRERVCVCGWVGV